MGWKPDRSVFNAHIAFRSKQQATKKEMHKLLIDHQLARSKQLETKCQQQNVSYDWTLTITWYKLDDFLALRSTTTDFLIPFLRLTWNTCFDLNATCFEVKASIVDLLPYRRQIWFIALGYSRPVKNCNISNINHVELRTIPSNSFLQIFRQVGYRLVLQSRRYRMHL